MYMKEVKFISQTISPSLPYLRNSMSVGARPWCRVSFVVKVPEYNNLDSFTLKLERTETEGVRISWAVKEVLSVTEKDRVLILLANSTHRYTFYFQNKFPRHRPLQGVWDNSSKWASLERFISRLIIASQGPTVQNERRNDAIGLAI